ncbi:sporulation protein YhbH [Sporomusa acidovorans]|uniref:UPF0229 protein SPACI_038370 n=1 Tax=Sporomusa acidovorans (strain ATCC 49682 / DSM 3132 / Mol) TaxID=1123286 RepID=A0ABZ3J635_SPOA4|nr:sporulation protein YhbH [Sporomusa acidovorans]OZC15110.1 hypothetical protein SPACI_50810 [Sporomusa acidovorans DSM 3132]SDF82396.1 hypothetical protein SAMN04488499_10913 [Sporomusa acidovorans]
MALFKDKSNTPSDRSRWDRQRHRQLVEDAIKKNIGGIIADESIIGQSKDKKVKVPVKGIKEYQFVYGNNNTGTGSGNGGEQRGQVVGKNNPQQGQGAGNGRAGNEPGEDIYETEISLEELVHYLFEDLQLPDMEQKKYSLLETERNYKKSGYQKKGIPPRLAKKRSVAEKIKRHKSALRDAAESTVPERFPFREDDLRYFRVKTDTDYRSNAVVICIMDTSGSMDQTRKYLARSFYFLLYQFVKYKYENVEVVFVAHTTEAQEVNEDEFFHKGESGGTLISSGYEKALEIIEQRYSPSLWNVYAFHCSDGDNWGSDNQKAVELAEQLCHVCNLFGYGEICLNSGWSTIRKDYEEQIHAPNFVMARINSKEDVWPAFKSILEKDGYGGEEE